MGAIAGGKAGEEGGVVEGRAGGAGYLRLRWVVRERGGIGLIEVVVVRVEGEGVGEWRWMRVQSRYRIRCAGCRECGRRCSLGINIQQKIRQTDRSSRMIEAMKQGSLVVLDSFLRRRQCLCEIATLGIHVAPELLDASRTSPVAFLECPAAAGRLSRDFGFDGLYVRDRFVAGASCVVGQSSSSV